MIHPRGGQSQVRGDGFRKEIGVAVFVQPSAENAAFFHWIVRLPRRIAVQDALPRHGAAARRIKGNRVPRCAGQIVCKRHAAEHDIRAVRIVRVGYGRDEFQPHEDDRPFHAVQVDDERLESVAFAHPRPQPRDVVGVQLLHRICPGLHAVDKRADVSVALREIPIGEFQIAHGLHVERQQHLIHLQLIDVRRALPDGEAQVIGPVGDLPFRRLAGGFDAPGIRLVIRRVRGQFPGNPLLLIGKKIEIFCQHF